ncbi:C4-dicarboxylate TRAP transporter substrate-binding protein [Pseudorhizobium flavum]|uniref:TRAP-type C4-dicarboxylate transport system substrate-binding protein n=1 Tax=Pseudorhizobium flavum TaxID=1335061 RepID=A0A7W9Z1M2_9HYPH|nr:C4-dicarboxylate TRAP transporter substrate-binding protein [Pseudorhizobium flavum]MBB6181531.1 TRAP-type C4-dicarboxylate transport system substrate-binding protein [Pseudorhizobium flavum]CAD6616736.1 C4-dicarboxylate ABC transporter substrate-binding protein [Pseudorhizobium flavum]
MRRMLGILAGIAALVATTADARELRIAPGAPPAHPSHSHLYSKLAELLPEVSGGNLTAQVLGPEVVGLGQMKDGLQSQLVEIGNLLPLYFPADLPNMSLAGELALSGREPHAMAAAMTEYMVTCDTCQEELKKFGVTYLGSGSSDVYALLTNKPVRTAEDVKGLRLRSGGAPFSRWAENFGAVPANIGVGDTFESMSQGVIDGSMASIGDLLSFRLVELVKNITFVPLGTYHATSDFTVANTTWESLSAEERKQLATAANEANVIFTQRWGYEMAAEAKATAEKAGIEFVEADPAFVEAVEAFAEADKETAAKVSQERFGFADAAERVARFSDLVEKWTGIVKEANGDPQEIAKRLDEEVWSKVDFETYGM